MSYQPKLNLEMARLGYIGADPKLVGLAGGYQARLTQPVNTKKPQAEGKQGVRPNPYIKQK